MTTITIGLTGTVTPPGGTQSVTPGSFAVGVNLSGLEYNANQVGNPGYNYAIPSLSELQYYKSQGTTLIRLPFAWEHLQPTLGGAFNATYLSEIEGVVNNAASLGMKVILDCHDYGGYGNHKLGDGTLTDAEFSSMWKQLATVFAGNPGIAGYDLMNEPNGMPNAQAWPDAAQAAITAIRTADTQTPIYVEGDDYSSAGSWTAVNSGLASLHDPSNNLIFSAHLYLDTDNSGTHFDWAQEAAAGDTVNIGVQRLTNFVQWLQANNLKGDIGEIGVGDDNTDWLTGLNNTLAYAQANNLQVTYWAGGPWWGSYPMAIDPNNGVTAPQVAVLDRYSGDMDTVTTASLSGSADANSTIYLSENDVTLGTTTTNSSGAWSYTLGGLAAGAHTIVASEVAPGVDGTIAAISFIVAAPATSSTSTSGAGTSGTGTSGSTTSTISTSTSGSSTSGTGTSSSTGTVTSSSGSSGSGTSSTVTTSGSSSSSGTGSVTGAATSSPVSVPVIFAAVGPIANVVIPASSGNVSASAPGQTDFRFVVAGTNAAVTNFSAGDTVQLVGASSYAVSNFDINDILWDNGSLTPYAWEMNGTTVNAAAALGGPAGADVLPGFHIAAVGDFDGTGTSSILLASDTPGLSSVIWNTSDGQLGSGALLPFASPSTVAWAGDFNGDGTSDILWDNGSDAPFLWEMQGDGVMAAASIVGLPGQLVMPGFHITGVGDFDGNGTSDILWASNVAGGFASIWFMNGFQATGVLLPYAEPSTKAWIGDFNGDGHSDILWDDGSATPVLWEMDGGHVIAAAVLGGAYGSTVMPGYHIAGVGDFTGNGDDDILWTANVPSPFAPAIVWFMNGTTVQAIDILPYGQTSTAAFIGNFNIDGSTIKSNTGTSVVLDNVAPGALASGSVQAVSSTLDYSAQTAAVSVDLATGTSSVTGTSVSGFTGVTGTSYNDVLEGYAPAGQSSTLTGNGGSDDYMFSSGDGAVTVINGVATASTAAGEVIFGPGLTDAHLWLAQVGNNLVIDVLGTKDQVTIQNWYANNQSKVSEIVDANGLKLDSAVNTLVNAMATFQAANPAFDPQSTPGMPASTTLNAAVLAAWHN